MMRVALVHDWLDTWGGGEAVLAELARAFPRSDVYTLVDFLDPRDRERIDASSIVASPLSRMPAARRWFRYAAVLRPSLIERFDLSRYDVILSDSHAIAKGARKRAGQLHVCYCHTPARFAWTMESTYTDSSAAGSRWRRALLRVALARFRAWDSQATTRVDRFVANSRHIAETIAACYGRSADVVHPPVDIERFAHAAARRAGGRRNDYVTLSRLVPYKRIDVIVEAFRRLPDRRLVVIGEGPERAALAARCPPNVTLAGRLDDDETAARIADARAFVFAACEDFGIAPIEAQAAGVPVIAYGRGGALETIRGLADPRPTGVFFDEQTAPSIAAALGEFESAEQRIDPLACRENAARFGAARFRVEMQRIVAEALARAPDRARAAATA
jgi:glycosyltransferase involved in cell wall biosynthesis